MRRKSTPSIPVHTECEVESLTGTRAIGESAIPTSSTKTRRTLTCGTERSKYLKFFVGDIVTLRKTHLTLDHVGGWTRSLDMSKKYKIVGKDKVKELGRTWECYILEDLTTGKILNVGGGAEGRLFAGVWIDLDPFMTAVNEAINGK